MESMLELGEVVWLLASFLSWLLLNAYVRGIGQRGIPLDLIGTWAVLVIMGGLLVLVFAGLGLMSWWASCWCSHFIYGIAFRPVRM